MVVAWVGERLTINKHELKMVFFTTLMRRNVMMMMITAVVAVVCAAGAWARPVDAVAARATAVEWMRDAQQRGWRGAPGHGGGGELTLAHACGSAAASGGASAYYVFTTVGGGGWVIVAGDDRATPVLAYGEGVLDMAALPPAARYVLDEYQSQIDHLLADERLQVGAAAAPSHAVAAIEPLITALWDQSRPYYNQCPLVGGKRCLTGCPATSLSMVFHYWQYPFAETASVPSHTFESGGTTYRLDELPPITFDWDNMLDSYSGSYTSEQADAVAWLMRYVGQAEQMEYAPDGSGSYGPNIEDAVRLFGYDEGVQNVYKSGALDGTVTTHNYSDSEWADLILNELENGRPIVYCGYSGSGWSMAGHAFNVDGWDGDGRYHVNFGWSGSANGYYALNAFSGGGYTFNKYQEMIIGIQPPPDAYGPTLRAKPAAVTVEGLVGHTATGTFTLRGYSLTQGATLTLNDDAGVFALDTTSICADSLAEGQTVTVAFTPNTYGTFSATVTCSTPEADDVTVTLTGVGRLETHDPVMSPADADAVTLTGFRADWSDQTAAANVANYTLEVNAVAPVIMLDSADWSDITASSLNQKSSADQYMPDGWTFDGKYFYLEDAAVSVGRGGTITTPALDLSNHGVVSVVVTARAYSVSTTSTLSVAVASQPDSVQTLTLGNDFDADTIVLPAADVDSMVFTAGYYPKIQRIEVYAGDLRAELPPTTDASTYRLVSGIAGKTRLLEGLADGGTYYYWVRANYVDGTVSGWSNIERVTLAGEPGYAQGDVNRDGEVTIADVNAIVDVILNSGYLEAADVNGDGEVTIADVNAVVDIILNQ